MKKANILMAAMAASLALSSAGVAVHATQSGGEDAYLVPVTVEIGSELTVTVPASIELSKDGGAVYNVNVKGDLSSDLGLSVVPSMTTMSDVSGGGKADLESVIDLSKQAWNYDEILVEGTDHAGSIQVDGLTAGQWAGTATFDVNIVR